MYILAMSKKGQEYIYKPSTARKVSAASKEKICNICNEYQFLYTCHPGYIWHVHQVDQYDTAFEYAQFQKFTIRKGVVKAINY